MLKKIFAGIVVVIVCAYGGLWLFAAVLHSKSDSNQWPENLGALSDVPNRYAESENNAAANALMKLTMPLGISVTPLEKQTSVRDGYDDVKKSISDYVSAQLERASDQSAPPPAAVEAFFAAHQTQIDQVRDHIANAGPIRWQMHFHAGADAPLPNLLGHMSLARLFTARALAKAANHDASAWDDLHVIWQLDNELWNRPELISQLIALAGSRMVNAAAVKMPLPEPAWLSELQSRDYRRDFARTFQAEASSWTIMFKNDLHKKTVKTLVTYPYVDACLADGVEQMRRETVRMASMSNCDLANVPPLSISQWNTISRIAFPNLTAAWQRVYRFQAEREATQKALALRHGRTPSTASVCTDGKWIVDANSVKFDRTIPIEYGTKYPLEYAVTR
jgi:hypothetical protein